MMSDAKASTEAVTNPAEDTTNAALPKAAVTEKPVDAAVPTTSEAVTDKENAVEKKDGSPNTEQNEESSKAANGGSQNKNGNDRNGEHRSRDQDRNHRRSHHRPGFRYQKANHNEYEDLEETDDPVKILTQVEFYFTTSNLATDEHMFFETEGPRNRPVPLKHITTFKRMKHFQPYSAVVAAIRDSELLELVEDGEFNGAGNEGVRRKTPITVTKKDGDDENEPSLEELFSRYKVDSGDRLRASIYAKNFGEGDIKQISIEEFFKPYGSIVVRKRRDEDGKWKGSVFVEFETVQAQQEFLALDPAPKFNGSELYLQDKKEYNEMKCKEKGIDPTEWNKRTRDSHYGRAGRGRGRGNGRGDRGGNRGRGHHNNRHNDRSNRHDNRRRNHSRSRSPRPRRDRDGSRSRSRSPRRDRNRNRSGSPDNRDWNNRRDKFQKGGYKDNRHDNRRGDRKAYDKSPKAKSSGVPVDGRGVPVVRDTRGEPEPKSNKRKADEEERNNSPKKSKIEFKEDA